MNGFLLIDKPAGITSMDVIRRLRKVLNTRKLGHTGTLDPAATGLLPVTIGSCTKLAKFLTLEPKAYEFEVVFGALTETADDQGAVVETGHANVDDEQLRAAMRPFAGEIEQRPPRYSALKVDGRRAYELAREGVEFELPARTIRIDALELLSLDQGVAFMRVTCGSGTYVRSLAVDIAAALGTVAHARGIRRLRVGAWTLEQATRLDDVVPGDVRPPREMMAELASVTLGAEEVSAIRMGKAIDAPRASDGFTALLDEQGQLIAVADARDGRLQPRRVLTDDD